MREEINSLEAILKEESNIYSILVSVATDMYVALKGKKIEKVSQLTGKYNDAITNIEKLERQRFEVCGEIARKLKHPSETPKLNDIISRIKDPQQKESLITLRKKLKEDMNEFSKINYSNEVMINDRINDIDAQYKIVVGATKASKVVNYNKKGSVDNNKAVGRNIFNTTG